MARLFFMSKNALEKSNFRDKKKKKPEAYQGQMNDITDHSCDYINNYN